MSAPAPPSHDPAASKSSTVRPERPYYGTQSRQHSRSSSQIATLASLALSPRAPSASLPASPRTGGLRPLAPIEPVGGAQSPARRETSADNSPTRTGDAAFGARVSASPRNRRSTSLSSSDDDTPRGSDRSSERERTGSGSTAPSTSSAESTLAAAEVRQVRKDRRSTFPSLVALPTVTSTSPSPVPSPVPDSTHSSGRSSPVSLPPTDPDAPARASFPSTSTSLAQFIQHKRRQASAPYFASARSQSLFSPGAGFSLGPSATEAAGGGAVPPSSAAVEGEGLPRPPSRNRSRASSRRATATALALQTAGLRIPPDEDAGLVVTPTTEEWRVLGSELGDLATLRAKEATAADEVAREEASQAREEERERKAPRWKRWPSLSDQLDDVDDDEDSHFALSLSLSTLGKYKHQLPRTPPNEPAGSQASSSAVSSSSSSESLPVRPVPTYKSSFSYTSTGSGVTGGFTSHLNTSSIARMSSTAPPSVALSPVIPAPSSDAPRSDPIPAVSTFEPTHRAGQKSDPSLAALSGVQAHSHPPHFLSRPALSRGSLSAAMGVLSSPPLPHSAGAGGSGESAGSETPHGAAAAEDESPAHKGMPHISLPPQVLRSLELDGHPHGHDGLGIATPPSLAATPFDGDPFASTAPPEASVPPTPRADGTGGHSPALDGAVYSEPKRDGAALAPVSLDWTRPLGPVDPRTYSAVTGLRDINSFVCEKDEAGKGAYGSVRRAREKGPGGEWVGPELVVKYVIKQRILADCWKKHKILGPIPIEVHVLDHLRRVPYEPRPRLNYLSRRPGARVGAGALPQHVRRDSAPQMDLWTGGRNGAPVVTGHPNICPLLDFWEDAHHYHLVMPSASASPTTDAHPRHGQDLFDHVDAHPDGLAPGPVRRILAQIADAVWFLHEHSIVHRDIKDENCVLDPDGRVRLIDFGSAAYVREGRKFDTFSGTLDFAAPEVLKGARYSGKEQDIWALGVLGYVLICGECPFWSPDEAMRGLAPDTRAYAALAGKVPPAPGPGSDEMAHAVDLVLRCLEIEAGNRPSADIVCDHKFFVGGEDGWSGPRGWECPTAGERE